MSDHTTERPAHPEGETMSYYDYHKFVHLVPTDYTIPAGTQVRSVTPTPDNAETFFTVQYDYPVFATVEMKFYLDYDITRPKLPEEINSVIYNLRALGAVYPVAVYQGSDVWSVFTKQGKSKIIYTPEIESFDTTPPKEESGGDDE